MKWKWAGVATKGRSRTGHETEGEGEMDSLLWTEHLRAEIEEARREWVNANRFFNMAEGKDQIDYAIYSVITAEKRYEMLLRVAKRTCKTWPEWGTLSS
ncbi:DUF2508 family protein [Paenibacillus sp. NPDC058071]|uniref:DUF2508 family protein n=1 Tax=Paenibacillus sp. NPDC058071 TaxID=3346326 RepID=UPI0036DF6A7C